MKPDKAVIILSAINESWSIGKKIKEFFSKFLKPPSKELIEFQYSDDDEPFKTGEEMWQYAKEIESRLQPRIKP